MPPNKDRGFGLLDTVVVLFISSALVLFVLWLGATFAGKSILDKLPDWLSKGISSVWTWLTTGAVAGAALRYRLRQGVQTHQKLPNYPLAIAATTVGMICLVLSVGRFVPDGGDCPNCPFLLKFLVAFADPQKHPPLSFIQQKPNWMEPQGLAALPDGNLYQVRVDLPQPAGEFKAVAQPLNSEGSVITADLHPRPLELCFVRAARNPANGVSHYYARVDCQVDRGCSVHPQEDPGWATNCPRTASWQSLPLCCIPAVYAQVPPAKTQAEAGWLIPSLPTLVKLRETKKIGYTEFLIQSGPLHGLAGSNYFTYDIKVNGTPVSIDGWRSSDLHVPLDPPKGIALQFGLENLNFSGADNGCETIDVRIAVLQQDKTFKTYDLFRQYAALRDAGLATIAAEDGQIFQWSGKYLNPEGGDRYEVFVSSTSDVQYGGKVKARIDRAGLKYGGQDLVGVLRPPLNNPVYGVIVGLRQPSGQVRFMFDDTGAQALAKWIQSSQSIAAVRSAFPKTVFVYKTRADDGTPRFQPCTAAGSRH